MERFIPFYEKITTWSLWKRSADYLKVFMFLLLNAAYKDTPTLKRGQVLTSRKELYALCESGHGASKKTISYKGMYDMLKYFERGFYECPIEVQRIDNDTLLITFLEYDSLVLTKNAPAPAPQMPPQKPPQKPTQKPPAYKQTAPIQNTYTPKSNATASKFNNFKPREKDYAAILAKKREDVRRLAAEHLEQHPEDRLISTE